MEKGFYYIGVIRMRFQFDAWLTKRNDFHNRFNHGIPIPMRVMFGKILKETDKCYYIDVYGKPEPTTHCLHCMRKLTHKVSMYYGLGPVCGKHYYIADVTEETLDAYFDEIRKKMANVRWRGLIPKNAVKIEFEDFYTFEFEYQGKRYRVTTSDLTKVRQIREKSDRIISEHVVKG